MNSDQISERLNRVRHLVGSGSKAAKPMGVPARYRRLAETVGGHLKTESGGSFCLIKTLYPLGHCFGNRRLDDIARPNFLRAASFSPNDVAGEVPIDRLLFFDTETTGLGGVGTVAFLIGFGSVSSEGFEVRQYLLPDYGDEAAMLEQVLTEFSETTTLVSYNGLAFDINLIRDRMIVNRVARKIPQDRHLDLLHPARRLYRRRLRDCSLTNLEREIFRFHRSGDIPGHLIPSVYFDWLQTDETVHLQAVLEHNRLDILALYFLALEIDQVFATDGAQLDYVDDKYSLARVYGRRRLSDKVVASLSDLSSRDSEGLAPDIQLYHALACKRTGDWAAAERLWLRLSQRQGRESHEACIELAKYYEHHVKDISKAHEFTLQARQADRLSQNLHFQLERRLSRLNKKLQQI